MSGFSIPLTKLIHENLSIIMCHAYSYGPLVKMREENFEGSFEYLDKTLFEIPELRAEKALMELALFLRTLDDDENISESMDKLGSFGKLNKTDGTCGALTFRDIANKIIHAERLQWGHISRDDGSKSDVPTVVSVNRRPTEKGRDAWTTAKLDLVAFVGACAGIAH